MPIKVRLSNAARITKREPTATSATNISRLTYQNLGSLIKNRRLIERDVDGNITGGLFIDGDLPGEYMRLLDELNNLYLSRNYPLLHGHLVIADGIVELDEYLGTLGVGEDYPYSKDAVDIPAWVTPSDRAPIRVLAVFDSNGEAIQYLTTNNDTEVLVRY